MYFTQVTANQGIVDYQQESNLGTDPGYSDDTALDFFEVTIHSALSRLAAAIKADKSKGLFAMFASYFDASGHSQDLACPFVVVAGYIANFNQWTAFEIEWERTLQRHRINQPFHTAEFMARKRPTSEFYDWNGSDIEADILLKELTTLESLFPVSNLSCVINLAEYREVAEIYDLQALPPFALGARWCMGHLYTEWLKFYRIPAKYMECVFEDGDFGRGDFVNVMRGDNMPAPIFKSKKDFAGLQAADHLAWEHFQDLKREARNETTPSRSTFHTLGLTPYISARYPKANLIELCELRGIKPK